MKVTKGKQKGTKEEAKKVEGNTVNDILKALEKVHGVGVVQLLGKKPNQKVDVISSGSYLLDQALGIGGIPRGRIIEAYGEPGGGKTTILLHVIANAQKAGLNVAFVDAELALDPELAKGMGVDIDNLVLVQPDYGEQALTIAESLVESGKFAVVGIDSVAALTPKAELDGDIIDQQMGLQARMMGKALRKLVAKAAKSNTCVIFVNQTRAKIGGMNYGGDDTTPGGKALKFFSSVRLDIRRIGAIKSGEDIIGNRVKIKVTKNKLAPPFKTVETDLIFGKGFNQLGELIDVATKLGLFEQSGSWYSHNGKQIGQGKPAVVLALEKDTALRAQIELAVKTGEVNENKENVSDDVIQEEQ